MAVVFDNCSENLQSRSSTQSSQRGTEKIAQRKPKGRGFLKRKRRAARFLDPVFCLGIGFAVFQVSPPLGAYIGFAAFSLRVCESDMHEKKRDADMDLIDGLIASKWQAQTVEEFETGGKSHRKVSPPISSGIDEDLKTLIKNLNK